MAGGAGRRSHRKAIRSLLQRIAEHEEKIRRSPQSPAVRYWQREIENFRREIERHKRRL